MLLRVNYVRSRKKRDGSTWLWWEHPKYGIKTLPQDPQAAAVEAQRLNGLALSGQLMTRNAEREAGTVSWCLAQYRASERYKSLAPGTRTNYERWLVQLRDMWGALPVSAITRKVVKKFAESLACKPGERGTALNVLSSALAVAHDEGLIPENPCHRLRIKHGKPRERCPGRNEIARILRHARCGPRARAATAWLRLLYYTGQRPMDVVSLTWDAWDGTALRLRQQKTKKLVWVPAHRSLRLMLRQLKATTQTTRIVPALGRDGTVYRRLARDFVAAWRAAGVEPLQARDLRRAAVVALGEAGCEPQQIGAITGHSLDETLRILEVYMPRTRKMAQDAIRAWERAGNRVGLESRTLENNDEKSNT